MIQFWPYLSLCPGIHPFLKHCTYQLKFLLALLLLQTGSDSWVVPGEHGSSNWKKTLAYPSVVFFSAAELANLDRKLWILL